MAIKQPIAKITKVTQNGADEHTPWNVAGVIHATVVASTNKGTKAMMIGSVNTNKILTTPLIFFIFFSWFKV